MGLLGLLLAPLCHCISLLNLLKLQAVAVDGGVVLKLQRLVVPVSLVGLALMQMSGNTQLGQICAFDRHVYGLILIFQQVVMLAVHLCNFYPTDHYCGSRSCKSRRTLQEFKFLSSNTASHEVVNLSCMRELLLLMFGTCTLPFPSQAIQQDT